MLRTVFCTHRFFDDPVLEKIFSEVVTFWYRGTAPIFKLTVAYNRHRRVTGGGRCHAGVVNFSTRLATLPPPHHLAPDHHPAHTTQARSPSAACPARSQTKCCDSFRHRIACHVTLTRTPHRDQHPPHFLGGHHTLPLIHPSGKCCRSRRQHTPIAHAYTPARLLALRRKSGSPRGSGMAPPSTVLYSNSIAACSVGLECAPRSISVYIRTVRQVE